MELKVVNELKDSSVISRDNVGSIAERIVSNELEYRGYRVSNLNKEGLSANADLLAVKNGMTWQIQVKGSTFSDCDFWFGYGQANEAMIEGTEPAFNKRSTKFYKAEVVVLVSVKSPSQYQCLVLPVDVAEQAAQINLKHGLAIQNWTELRRSRGRFGFRSIILRNQGVRTRKDRPSWKKK
jgi:hypothetical protein